MTDMLSMVLIFFSAFFFLQALEKENKRHAILSGLTTGLLLLSKQTGIIVLSFYFFIFFWLLWKDKNGSKIMLYILVASLVIYVPYLVWALHHQIDVFGFLSLFLGNKPEWASLAVKSFRRYESSLKEFAYLFYTGNGLIMTISLLIPICYIIKSRAKELSYNCIFALLMYLMLAMSVWHITNTRHTLSLLPILTFLVGYGITRLFRKKALINFTIIFLFIVSAHSLYKMPNWRLQYNAPIEFMKLTDIIKKDQTSNGRTLVIYAFDTLMYTRRNVIWPYPNLNEIPIDLVEKQTAPQLYTLFKKYQIDYILIDTRFILNADHFNGRTYPLYFIRNCEKLDKQGKLSLRSISDSRKFILLKVS
jgi:hypothetical protein